MADVKRFVVLGLGSFGTALAKRLSHNGCKVTGVDRSKERIDALRDELHEAIYADVTDRQCLAQLLLPTAHAVFISLGENIEPSLLATLHCKELGAKRLLAKGVTPEHGKILERLGVERVIYPEAEIATDLADRMTWPNVLDFVPIDPEYSFVEMAVPQVLAGKTLREADLRRKHGIWVLGVKDVLTNRLHIIPDGDFKLSDDQMLLLISKKPDLLKFRELE